MNNYQESFAFVGQVREMRAQGLTEIEIASELGFFVKELRLKLHNAHRTIRAHQINVANSLKDLGHPVSKIAKHMALNESSVRNLLTPKKELGPELELTDKQIARNDEIDNAVYECLHVLTEMADLDWNMEIIGEATDALKTVLINHGYKVRHPGIITEPDGSQHYEE